MTLQELQVVITAQTSGLTKQLNTVTKDLDRLNTKTVNTTKAMSSAFGKLAAIVATIGIGKAISDGITEAIAMEANIENLNRTLGKSATEFIEWGRTIATSLGISQSQAMKYGSTFSNLVSSFVSDTSVNAQMTQQLLQTSAIIASKTGRTIEDVMERIRSGMLGSTEAIEDLGVYTKVSAIEQTKAFKQMSNGTPWNQLSYQMQQQIMTLAILEQASTKYGDTIGGSLATKMLVFRAQLDNLKLALGQVFLPIVNTIIPYLTTFINYIAVALSYVIAFSRALFGMNNAVGASADMGSSLSSSASSSGTTADNLGTAADNAKKIQSAMSGIDELNVINKADASASSGIGGTSASVTAPIVDTSLQDQITQFNANIDEMRKKIEGVSEKFKQWLPLLAAIATLLAGLWVAAHWESITGAVANFLGLFGLIGKQMSDTFPIWTTLRTKMASVFAGGIMTVPILAIIAVIALFVGAIVQLWNTNEEFRTKMISVWNGIRDTLLILWNTVLYPIFQTIAATFLYIWTNGLQPLWDAWVGFVGELLIGVGNLLLALKPFVDYMIKTFGPFIVTAFQIVGTAVGLIIVGLIQGLTDLVYMITSAWTGLNDTFGNMTKWFTDTILEPMKGIFKSLGNLFVGFWNLSISSFEKYINFVIDGINKVIKFANKCAALIDRMLRKLGGSFTFRLSTVDHISIEKIPALANGGSLSSGQYFQAGENGKAEAIGSYKGKTTVMPLANTDFVQAIYEAVYNAISDVDNSGQVIENVVNLDGNVIYKNQQQVARNRGVNFNMGVFAR